MKLSHEFTVTRQIEVQDDNSLKCSKSCQYFNDNVFLIFGKCTFYNQEINKEMDRCKKCIGDFGGGK